MNTWISRRLLKALAFLTLAACAEGQGPGKAPTGPQTKPMMQAGMLSGAVTLVAPPGYCIDRQSLKPTFALMARCDTLGAPGFEGNAPLGVITTSLVAAPPKQPVPDARQIGETAKVKRVLKTAEGDDMVLLQAEGSAPGAGLSSIHWRGAARVGDNMAAVAVYGPEGSPATGATGRRILTRLIERTRAMTPRPGST